MTAMSSITKAATTLMSTTRMTEPETFPRQQRVEREKVTHRRLSTRRSTTGCARVDEERRAHRVGGEVHARDARGNTGVGADGDDLRTAGGRDLHLAAGIDADARQIARVDAQARLGDEALQQRRLRDQSDHRRTASDPPRGAERTRRAPALRGARPCDPTRRARVRLRRRLTSAASTGSAGASPSTLIGSQEVPEPSSAMSERSRVRSTISSRCAAIGTTTPSRAVFTISEVTPASAARPRAISSVTSSTVAEIEIAAETQRELGGDAPVVHGRAFGRDLAADPLHAALRGW